MFKNKVSNRVEDGVIFTFALTFIGGYMNAYSYFVRGGSLVTMQSGNMVRIGLAAYLQDLELFIISFIPIIGCFTGVAVLQLTRRKFPQNDEFFWQKSSILAEILIFLIVGFIPMDYHNHALNFTIAMASGFQLCHLKNYGGYTHTTTLGSGNVRNLGLIFANAVFDRDKSSIKLLFEYFILMSTFTIGAYLGSVASDLWSSYSIWVCAFMMIILLILTVRLERERTVYDDCLADIVV